MHIGGLLKYSLIDYPPHVSCVIFTAGCNFRCPYCHNPELAVTGPETLHLRQEDIMDFLASRRKYLDGVVISGGEPSLHPDLGALCAEIKAMGFLVKLDTNGSHPGAIEDLLKNGLVDYLAMDVKTAPERYNEFVSSRADAQAVRRSARIIIESGISHEFRSTCVHPLINRETIGAIAEMITGADLHAFQRLQDKRVLDPEFFAGRDRSCPDSDLHAFQAFMADHVKKAIIR